MPLQATSGAASYDAFGGGVPVVPQYIEEVFSTWLYTGNETVNTITNGIDLSGKGGMVWIKSRNSPSVPPHRIFDTVRGVSNGLSSNTTAAQGGTGNLSSFNSTGFGLNTNRFEVNEDGFSFASWTFRKQPKFFDVVTYTGTGSVQNIAHNLGSVPGCIIVKTTNAAANWVVYHRTYGGTYRGVLNSTTAFGLNSTMWNDTSATSSVFTVGTNADTNTSGNTYVAYIFAHDAGGFGLTGTDNVISCGSYTGNGSATGPVVTLGYEPQWLMIKKSSSTGNWQMLDNLRGMPVGSADATLQANLANAEASVEYVSPTATGFQVTSTNTEVNTSAATYIYIAIRRGPMKVPTDATSVFSPITSNASTGTTNTTNFPVDFQINAERGAVHASMVVDRLRGVITTPTDATSPYLRSDTSVGENPETVTRYWNNTGFETSVFQSGASNIYWNFRRAPSFHDIVCYTGTGSNTTVTHSLQAIPELILVKRRSASGDWQIYCSAIANTEYLVLNSTAAKATGADRWNSTTPTSSVFSIGNNATVNASAGTYVAYLFATTAGVSKVGTYTGNGSTQTIDCGLTAGARFVLIKRTDSTGGWYAYDTARGMTVLTDPYLFLNTTDAEVATLGSVTTVSTGFALNSTILAAINVSAATYIFLAIA